MYEFLAGMKDSQIRTLVLGCFLLGSAVSLPASGANPSNKDFDAGIAIHGKEHAGKLASQAQALYEECNAATIKFAETAKENRVARLNWKTLGQNEVRLEQLRRVSEQLQLLGETAGLDYSMRAEALLKTNGDVIELFRGTPESQKQLDPVRLALRKQEPVRARELEKWRKLATEGKWAVAEEAMHKFLDELGVATACLFIPERRPIYEPFDEVRSAIESAMRQARAAQAKQLLRQRRQADTPDFASVLAEAEAAIAAVSASGTVSLDGASLTGPQAFTKFGERWAAVQVQAIRCRTLDWLIGGSDAMYDTSGAPRTSPIVGEFASFNQSLMAALARLIEADAGRVSGTDAVNLYVDYLRACAPLVRRSSNQSLAGVVRPALQTLAARAPQFPAEVAAYEEATGDLLRWRARIAGSRARAQAAAFPSVDSLMFEATRSDAEYTGLYPAQNAQPPIAMLMAPAPLVISRPITMLQDKQAHALDAVRLNGDGPLAIARFRVRSYANVPAPLDLAAEIDALKADLMVGDQLPPISLLAAVALDSAERGDLAAVGGTIANQYLESLTSRFAALPTAASVMTPLGEFPQFPTGHDALSQMLMRFDLTPEWAQHDFFFVKFPPPAGPAE